MAHCSAWKAAHQNAPVRYDLLCEEIVRQSLMIATRDEFGFTTRDEVLGERSPVGTASREFELVTEQIPGSDIKVKLSVIADGEENAPLWESSVEFPSRSSDRYLAVLQQAEHWSRNGIREALSKAGVSPRKKKTADEVMATSERLLARANHIMQFYLVRSIHEQVQHEGESDTAIANLVRAYANLGMLTEHHWNDMHRAFKACSLLYAQRLVVRLPKNPASLQHRAYALALTGLHNHALLDLAAAEALGEAADDGNRRTAAWVKLLDLLCRFDFEHLAQEFDDEQYGPLAAVFHFLTLENRETPRRTIESAFQALNKNPFCFRVVDGMYDVSGVSMLHRITEYGPAMHEAMLRQQMPRLPGLPESAKELLDVGEDEVVNAANLVAELHSQGTKDGNEFSWQVLAKLTAETNFCHVWTRAHFMHHMWSVPVDNYLREVAPLIESHPYQKFVNMTGYDDAQLAELMNSTLSNLHRSSLPPQAQLKLLASVEDIDRRQFNNIRRSEKPPIDQTHRALTLRMHATREKADRLKVAEQILEISKHSPVGIAFKIKSDGKLSKEEVEELTKPYRHHPAVLRALAESPPMQGVQKKFLEEYVRLSPDYSAVSRLADWHKFEGDIDNWLATLERYLKLPPIGLEHGRIRVDIAEHFMGKKEWDRALPYAEAAAESYAQWAMRCAVQCNQGKGDLDRAQLWYSRMADRYPSSADAYIDWLRNHDRNDPQFIALRVSKIEQEAKSLPWNQRFAAGCQLMLLEEYERALSIFAQATDNVSDARSRCYNGLFAAVLAHKLGRKQQRDEILKTISNNTDATQAKSQQLAGLMLAAVNDEATTFNTTTFAKLLEDANSEDRVNLNYFVGKFLAFSGQPDAATVYFKASSTTPDTENYVTNAMARQELRDARNKGSE